MILVASPASSLINTFFIKCLYFHVGEEPILYFGSAMSILALYICFYHFDEKLDLENKTGKKEI